MLSAVRVAEDSYRKANKILTSGKEVLTNSANKCDSLKLAETAQARPINPCLWVRGRLALLAEKSVPYVGPKLMEYEGD